jgi:hypothetical protein
MTAQVPRERVAASDEQIAHRGEDSAAGANSGGDDTTSGVADSAAKRPRSE